MTWEMAGVVYLVVVATIAMGGAFWAGLHNEDAFPWLLGAVLWPLVALILLVWAPYNIGKFIHKWSKP